VKRRGVPTNILRPPNESLALAPGEIDEPARRLDLAKQHETKGAYEVAVCGVFSPRNRSVGLEPYTHP
jgi:hypothetical protein